MDPDEYDIKRERDDGDTYADDEDPPIQHQTTPEYDEHGVRIDNSNPRRLNL